jgi:uncharacterized protein (TIGR03118 family)
VGLSLELLEDRCVPAGHFQQTNLVSDIPGMAAITDANLSNPWGITQNGNGPFWIADNGTGLSTLYNGSGQAQPAGAPLVVTIPTPSGASPGVAGSPSGAVFNGGNGFTISKNGVSGPALFLFATEDGTISGWNPNVDPTHAILAVDNSNTFYGGTGAQYKGLTIGSTNAGTFLYAADFKNGAINIYDTSFHKATLTGNFSDPSLPTGYGPFNVQNIGGNLFVAYDQLNGSPTGGFVDEFSTNGVLIKRIASQGPLNAPWGLVQAPAQFGPLSNDLLVGNFGDGRINAFDLNTNTFVGALTDGSGNPIVNDRIWSLTFGNGGQAGDPNTLFFTAGIQNEAHGLFGSIRFLVDQPLTAQGQPVTAIPGTAFTGTVATFSDADLNTPAGSFSAMINWGDGSATTAGVVTSTGSGSFSVSGTHTYTVAGTFSLTVSITDNDTSHDSGGSTALASSSVVAGDFNQRFVAQLYLDLLNRPVDSFGLSFWTGLLNAGGSQSQVVQGIESSMENLTNEVKALYHRFLGRDADAFGLNFWVTSLSLGSTLQQVESGIIASDEYFNLRGGGTAAGFLQSLYQDLFQRSVDPLGLQVWAPAITNLFSRDIVAGAILGSLESAQAEVQALYNQVLHRSADPLGLAVFGGDILAGTPLDVITGILVGSAEYQSHI